jgi:hypothetical protein
MTEKMYGQNFLSPVEFQFTIKRMPTVQYYVQSINIPAISSGFTEQVTPFRNTYRHGDKLTYDDLSITIAVDENLTSYMETYSWLKALTKPEEFDQYAGLIGADGDGLYSDATLTVLNSSKKSNIEISFSDMFPTFIGAITMNTASSDVPIITCDLTFKYNSFKIKSPGNEIAS